MNHPRIRTRQMIGEMIYRTIARRPVGSLSVLMYHAVTSVPLGDAGQESIGAAQFAAQMAALRSLGVDVVGLGEGVRRLGHGPSMPPLAAVVFDDGYVGVHDFALDVLVRHQIPATLFLATGSIGRPAFPWAPPSLGRPLAWAEVTALVREAGCEVGSHSHTHRVLTGLDSAAVRDELVRSSAAIQQHVGMRPRLFAYPYGFYGTFDARTRGILSEEGFVVGCTTVWGQHARDDDPLAMRRLRVSWCDSVYELRKSLAGCYDWYRIVQRVQAWAGRARTRRPSLAGGEDALAHVSLP